MLRLPLHLVLPRTTTATVRRIAEGRPGHRPHGVRIRVRGDALVARRWVHGVHATGHSVLRARMEDVPEGVLVRGTVTPSGLDQALVWICVAAAGGIAGLGLVYDEAIALLVALVPLALGILFASWLPEAVRTGHDVLRQAVLADLDGPAPRSVRGR